MDQSREAHRSARPHHSSRGPELDGYPRPPKPGVRTPARRGRRVDGHQRAECTGFAGGRGRAAELASEAARAEGASSTDHGEWPADGRPDWLSSANVRFTAAAQVQAAQPFVLDSRASRPSCTTRPQASKAAARPGNGPPPDPLLGSRPDRHGAARAGRGWHSGHAGTRGRGSTSEPPATTRTPSSSSAPAVAVLGGYPPAMHVSTDQRTSAPAPQRALPASAQHPVRTQLIRDRRGQGPNQAARHPA
jgi:hypothetical protein